MTDEEQLRRQIGQLMAVGFHGVTVPETAATLIGEHPVGHILLFARNIARRKAVRRLTEALQTVAREDGQDFPLTISADQENGVVSRLSHDVPGLPGSMALGATGRPEDARQAGQMTGRLIGALGINFDLAPVLDVNNNPENPVIGVRSFGDDPERVGEFGAAFIHGLHAEGIIAAAKHFPGHGDTDVDSHRGLPVISHARERLDHVELPPFVAAIAAGVDVIMTAHVVFPAVEPSGLPATLSRRVLTDLLRGELGFDGVITTDCLEMDAISKTVGVGPGAVMALRAGADLVMVSHRLDRQLAAIEAVFQAVKAGELPEARVQEAAARVRTLKKGRLDAPRPAMAWDAAEREARALQARLAGASLTRLRWEGRIPDAVNRIAVLRDDRAPVMVASGPGAIGDYLTAAVRDLRPDIEVECFGFPEALSGTDPMALTEALRSYDVVLAGINGARNRPYLDLVNGLSSRGVNLVTLLLRSPYDARLVDHVPKLLALYEPTPWMARAAVASLFGGPADGRLPVFVSSVFPRGFRAQA